MAKKDGISVVVSEDFDAYASGRKGAHQVRCLMCGQVPCSGQHPEFGSEAYLAQMREIHGK